MRKGTRHFVFICTLFALLMCAQGCTPTKKGTDSVGTEHSQTDVLPLRIVSLSPAGTEILYALGADKQIVARTDFCDFPSSVTEKPSVGGFSGETLSIETILSFNPDFVYGTQGIHDMLAGQLAQAGIKTRLSQAKSIADIFLELQELSVIVNGSDTAGQLCVEKIKAVFSAVQEKVTEKSVPLVYYEVWNAPFMSIGSKSYINDIVFAAGGENIFASVTDEYPLVSEEAIVAINPDIIIIPDMNGESKKSIEDRHGWADIAAVKNERIYFAESNVFSRPGPRITEALGALCAMIHPEVDFSSIDFVIIHDNVPLAVEP